MNQLAKCVVACTFMLTNACKATSDSNSEASARVNSERAPIEAQDLAAERNGARVEERGIYREPSDRLTTPYPRGRWRLATFTQLDQAMIWPAHILIRHQDVAAGLVSFSLPLWNGAPAPPERTRHAALELAERLAAQLHSHPDQFAELARQHSEDIATRGAGGALGGVSAFRLSDWPEVLDAFAALKPGEVSRVVETGYGFHVLSLRPPPEAGRVSGAHIVIGYDDAPWLHRFLARRPIPPRSRAEAEALAHRVYQEALLAPSDFSRFVQQYSEQYDAELSGDFGQWSTLEPTPYPDAVELLQHLEPGEIAPPIDSPFGFRIIQRTPERARERYGEEVIQYQFDAMAPEGEPSSRSLALQTMEGVVHTLRTEPDRFAEFQSRFCCLDVRSFSEGRGPPREERIVRSLAVGEIATELLEANERLSIVRRVVPKDDSPRSASMGLPSPEKPDLDFFFETGSHADTWREFGEVAARLPGLDADQRARIREIHAKEVAFPDPDSGQSRVVFAELMSEAREVLGVEQYAPYLKALQLQVEHELLEPAPGPRTLSAQ